MQIKIKIGVKLTIIQGKKGYKTKYLPFPIIRWTFVATFKVNFIGGFPVQFLLSNDTGLST